MATTSVAGAEAKTTIAATTTTIKACQSPSLLKKVTLNQQMQHQATSKSSSIDMSTTEEEFKK